MNSDYAADAARACDHFDEWQDAHGVRMHWRRFFELESAVELAGKQGDADRQIRDNGITYNVYADTRLGPARRGRWTSCLILDDADWRHIASGSASARACSTRCWPTCTANKPCCNKACCPPSWCWATLAVRALRAIARPAGVFAYCGV